MEAEAPSLFDGDGEGPTTQRGEHPSPVLGPTATIVGSICELGFYIPGKPVAKQRPRFAKRGNFVQTFTPEETVNYEQYVALEVKQQLVRLQMDGRLSGLVLPLEGRIVCDLRFNLDKPKSSPKRVVHHLKRPDVDNLAKSILDALQNVGLIKEDNIVTDLSVRKRFSEPGHPQGVEVEVLAWLT